MRPRTAAFTWQEQRPGWLVVGAATLAVALYGYASVQGQVGFPLDDAWIHQTYARNLALNGRWEYVPGVTSAGSTAPLWTVLLAVGYWLRLPPTLWAYVLGALCLVWAGRGGAAVWRSLRPAQAHLAGLVSLILVLTWQLVWAATSGMETLLFVVLGLEIVSRYMQGAGEQGNRGVLLGLLCGLLVLVRPDGLLLLLLTGIGLLTTRIQNPKSKIQNGLVASGKWQVAAEIQNPKSKIQNNCPSLILFLLTAALPLLPYFAFNLWNSGHLWPNTFYAKQAEYDVLLARPLLLRLGRLLWFSLGGPESGWQGLSGTHLLLLPGLLTAGWLALRADLAQKHLRLTLPLLWAGGHIFLYAWRLPVTYQHGRYLWAALPVWVVYGLAGWQMASSRWQVAGSRWQMAGGKSQVAGSRWQIGFAICHLPLATCHLLRRAAVLAFAILLLLFFALGAGAYAQDVAFIEAELAQAAGWLRDNTPPDALIAAHDVGAIGYFAGRPLLDLAGLVNPELIPFLTDEAALAAYLQAKGADYLVTAPGWPYRTLLAVTPATLAYQSDFAWTRSQGVNNVAVYRLEVPAVIP